VITVTGLGPGDFDRIPEMVRSILLDPGRTVIIRTINHPAAEQLAGMRVVVTCDDLYQGSDDFEGVYAAIVERVMTAAGEGPVVYAVPGSPMVGEFVVRQLIASEAGVELIPGESFVDAILAEIGYDPLDRGLQILNGHELPDPLILDKPTIVGHLDRPEIMAEVAAEMARVLPEEATVTVFAGLGSADAIRADTPPDDVDARLAGFRTSMFVDAEPGGLIGAVGP
jgi:tetrapyrrole methylase family protein/MazG family protein